MENLVQVDRKTPFLMPQDLKDWLPENHIVHFITSEIKTRKHQAACLVM